MILPEGSIALDSLSTIELLWDAGMLKKVRKNHGHMMVTWNLGQKEVKEIGHLAGYNVWFDPTTLANILFLGRVASHIKATFHSG